MGNGKWKRGWEWEREKGKEIGNGKDDRKCEIERGQETGQGVGNRTGNGTEMVVGKGMGHRKEMTGNGKGDRIQEKVWEMGQERRLETRKGLLNGKEER